MNKAKFKKLIQIPLSFHHQDIHDRLDTMEQSINEIKALVLAIVIKSRNE